MSAERWVKVTDEAELRPGMVVRVGGCLQCNRQHVVMLLRLHSTSPATVRGGESVISDWWVGAPARACARSGFSNGRWAFASAISEGRASRLDTGLDDAAEREEGRRIYGQRDKGVEAWLGQIREASR